VSKKPSGDPAKQLRSAFAIIEEHLGRFVIVSEPTHKAESVKPLLVIHGNPHPFTFHDKYLSDRQRTMLSLALSMTEPKEKEPE
jgi:hypothetical protein